MRDSDRLAFYSWLASLLGDHTPSLSEQDEEDILAAMVKGDPADWAKRTCSCGERIDGFYEYLDHLKQVASK